MGFASCTMAAPGAPSASGGEGRMKLIVSVIKPFKLEEVREALTAIGVQGLMVSEVKGYGRQSGHTEIYRGAEYVVNFVPKVKLELVVPDAAVNQVIDALARTAKTGKIGDGKIFVLDVEQAMRVRTGETGDEAL
jgi:nitrogen regulatory protein PII